MLKIKLTIPLLYSKSSSDPYPISSGLAMRYPTRDSVKM